jgi:hypothetical protein
VLLDLHYLESRNLDLPLHPRLRVHFANGIVPYILCHGRVCDGIRLEHVYKFDVDISGFGWKPLQVKKHDNWPLIHAADCLTYRFNEQSYRGPRNKFFLHDWVSDPKAGIVPNHHNVSLWCPRGKYFAIVVKTGSATIRWKMLSMWGPQYYICRGVLCSANFNAASSVSDVAITRCGATKA